MHSKLPLSVSLKAIPLQHLTSKAMQNLLYFGKEKQAIFGVLVDTHGHPIKNAIIEVVNSKNTYLEKSKNALEFIKNEFLWEKVAEDTLREYKELC